MKHPLTRQNADSSWDAEIALNTQMFRDADRLDQAAYLIIEVGTTNSEIWQQFSEAKALADEKRNAAYQDWIRIKRLMMG
ncbi:hypothetical protein DXT77_05660 [Pseudomonas sp. 91RF]|jgi:hypothetical protein|uniref:hypothetical protein n=1 Tax=Pseudomonas sp. 91RF TaxID=2292261 RepID=UPI000E675792|nr:hypothetical protein [Pseudomonas sp. 91RF]RIJ12017.1 hypothetical protein DXT77_05660 [Pseudomonas sp. 91RF]